MQRLPYRSIKDDMNIVHTARDICVEGKDLTLEMQEALRHWQGGSKVTGGDPVPGKSFWHSMDFEWKKGKMDMCNKRRCGG